MDFTTTEAAHDLGGLVDTIVDSVCTPEHQRELDGLRATVRPRAVEQAGRLRHPDQRIGLGAGRRRFRRARTGRHPGCAGPPVGRGAVPGVGDVGRRVRWPGSAPRNCSRAGAYRRQRREDPAGRPRRRDGRGPVQATRSGDGYRLTGTRTQVGFGPVADAFLVPAETDSGTAVFLVAADDPGVKVTALADDRLGQHRAPGAGRRRVDGCAAGRGSRSRHLARHAGDAGPRRVSARGAGPRIADDRRICPRA